MRKLTVEGPTKLSDLVGLLKTVGVRIRVQAIYLCEEV